MHTRQDTDLNLWGALLGLLITLGLAAAGLILGIGVTGLAGETKSFWYLSRAAGFVAYLLLWASVVWGLLLSSKIAQGRLRPPALFDAHRFLSYVALGFAFFHGLVLMGDRYLSFPLNAVLAPFASSYKPTLVAAGQLALWLSLLVSLSFLVQKTADEFQLITAQINRKLGPRLRRGALTFVPGNLPICQRPCARLEREPQPLDENQRHGQDGEEGQQAQRHGPARRFGHGIERQTDAETDRQPDPDQREDQGEGYQAIGQA